MYAILPITPADIPAVLRLAKPIFAGSGIDVKAYLEMETDWELSVKLVEKEKDLLVGFYLFNSEEFSGLHGRGIQGVALGVAADHRGKGAGKQLIQYSYSLPYDYIWGRHLAYLNNRDHWAKRREIMLEGALGFLSASSLRGDPLKIVWEFPFIFQPDGVTCGCAVIKMLLMYLQKAPGATVEDIAKVCGTDALTGTTDKKMKKGLMAFGLKHQQNKTAGDAERQIHYLNQLLDAGDVFALRGLVGGSKHWYLVFSRNREWYYINDPWLGRKILSREELLATWAPRSYDGFRIFLQT